MKKVSTLDLRREVMRLKALRDCVERDGRQAAARSRRSRVLAVAAPPEGMMITDQAIRGAARQRRQDEAREAKHFRSLVAQTEKSIRVAEQRVEIAEAREAKELCRADYATYDGERRPCNKPIGLARTRLGSIYCSPQCAKRAEMRRRRNRLRISPT